MCVRACVRVYVHIHIREYACVSIYIHIGACMLECVCVCVCVCMYVFICALYTCMCLCVHARANARVHTCVKADRREINYCYTMYMQFDAGVHWRVNKVIGARASPRLVANYEFKL